MANQNTAWGTEIPSNFSYTPGNMVSDAGPWGTSGNMIDEDGGYTGPPLKRTPLQAIKDIPGTIEGLYKGVIGFAIGGSTATVGATYHSLKTGDWDEFKPVFDHMYNDVILRFPKILGVKLTQPQTKAGERVLTMLDKEVFQRVHRWAEAFGDKTFEETGSPALATFAKTATEGVGLLVPIIGTRAVGARPGPPGAKPLTKWEKAKTFGIEEGIAYKVAKKFPAKRYTIPGTKMKLPPLGRGAPFKWQAPTFENNPTPGLVVSFETFKAKVLEEHPTLSYDAIEAQYRASHELIRDYQETQKRKTEEQKPDVLDSGIEVHHHWDRGFEPPLSRPIDQAMKAEIQALSILKVGEHRAREGANPKTGKPYAQSTYTKKFIQYANNEVIKKWYEDAGRGILAKTIDEAILRTEAIDAAKKIGRLVKAAQSRVPDNFPKELASEIISLIQPAVLGKSGRLYLSDPKSPSMFSAAKEALRNGEENFIRVYTIKTKDGKPMWYNEGEIVSLQEIVATGKSIAETSDLKYLKNIIETNMPYKTDVAKAVKKQYRERILPVHQLAQGAKGIKKALKKEEVPPNTGEDAINPYIKTMKDIYKESGLDVEEIFAPKKAVPEQVTKAVDAAKQIPAEAWVEAGGETPPSTIIAQSKPSALVNTQIKWYHQLLHWAGGRAISFWKTDNKLPGTNIFLRDISPAFREIMDSIYRPEPYSKFKKVMDSYHASRHTRAGTFQSRLNDAFYPLKAQWFPHIAEAVRGWRGNPKVNKPLAEYTTNPKPTIKIPASIKTAGDKIRNLLDDFHVYAKKVLPDLEYHKYWLPRSMDWRWAEKNRVMAEDIVTNIFQKYPNSLTEAQKSFGAVNTAREAAIGMVENLVNNRGSIQISPELLSAKEIIAEGRFKNINEAKVVARKAGSLDFERVFKDIPDAEFGKLIDPSVYKRVQRYIEDGTARVEYARINGPNSELLYNRIHRAAEELAAAGRPLRQQEVEHLVNLWSAFQGIYKSNTAKWWIKVQKAEITLMNAALLPLATVASMPETALPMYHGGVRAYGKGMRAELFNTLPLQIARSINKDWKLRWGEKNNGKFVDKTRGMLIVEAINKAGDIALMERMNQLWAGDYTVASNFIFRANGLFYWTKWMNHLAVSTFDFMIRDYFESKAAGKKTGLFPEEEVRMEKLMDYYGLNVKDGIKWVQEGSKLEGRFFEKVKRGALTFAEDSVLTPNAAIVPLWHANPGLAWLKHLKAFPTLISNSVLRRWGSDTMAGLRENGMPIVSSRNATYAVSTGMMMILLAHLSNVITDQIRYGEENPFYKQQFQNDKWRWLIRAVERWGIMGPAQFGLDAVFHSHASSPLTVIMGPGFNKADRFANAALSGNARSLGREMASLTPVGNVRKEWRDGLADMYTEFLDNNMGFAWSIKDSGGRQPRRARSAR